MATVLFITRTDLVKNSIIDGNTDTDLFIQFIKVAQEIEIKNYLGTTLYDKITIYPLCCLSNKIRGDIQAYKRER